MQWLELIQFVTTLWPTFFGVQTNYLRAMGKLEFYEIENAWKMFPAQFQGFADRIFAELRSIDLLWLIRVYSAFWH